MDLGLSVLKVPKEPEKISMAKKVKWKIMQHKKKLISLKNFVVKEKDVTTKVLKADELMGEWGWFLSWLWFKKEEKTIKQKLSVIYSTDLSKELSNPIFHINLGATIEAVCTSCITAKKFFLPGSLVPLQIEGEVVDRNNISSFPVQSYRMITYFVVNESCGA